jgi:hypothetical protein
MAEQGAYIGGKVPFGYRLDGEGLREHVEEQAAIRQARSLRAQGLSLRAVADRLQAMEVIGKVG